MIIRSKSNSLTRPAYDDYGVVINQIDRNPTSKDTKERDKCGLQ